MRKLIKSLMVVLLGVISASAQRPIPTVSSITREGTKADGGIAYLRVYNSAGTSAVSYITVASSDTNVMTVTPSTATLSNNLERFIITFADGLAAGNYSANIVITQTNDGYVVNVPVTLRIVDEHDVYTGSLADILILSGTTASMPAIAPRKYGDVVVGKIAINDVNGTEYDRMNIWVSEGTSTDDWHSLVGEVYTSLQLLAPQRDTNAVTTATAYTPRYFGDMLIGRIDAVTGAVWCAYGTTTNDWLRIAP